MRYHTAPSEGPDHASPPREVAYFRDPFDTLFAAEVLQAPAWQPVFGHVPEVGVADVRVLVMPEGGRPSILPPWVVAGGRELLHDFSRLAPLVSRAWVYSPHHRAPGPEPAAYVAAAFQALCPPHPACPTGPHSRASVIAFAHDRRLPIGRLAEEGRDGFDRWLRVCWPDPASFARDVLFERLRDAGRAPAETLVRYLDAAEVAPDAEEYEDLRRERQALLPRAHPLRFFLDGDDFDRAQVEMEAWRLRYEDAYAVHYRRVRRLAAGLLEEIADALAAGHVLRGLNAQSGLGDPVGGEALGRLERASALLRALPEDVLPGSPRTGGVVLGRVPGAFAEARLAAAAVLAAVEVQRRRAMV